MNIQVISFNCVLKNKAGTLISSTFNRDVLTSIPNGNDMPLAALAKGLQNLNKGEKRSVSLNAEEAYGLYNPKKVIFLPKKMLSKPARVGESVAVTSPNGKILTYTVLEYYGDMVRLDGNHPLAGQDLIFEIEALDAREATAQEVEEALNTTEAQTYH